MYQARQCTSFLHCRRQPIYLFSSMSLFIVVFLSTSLSFSPLLNERRFQNLKVLCQTELQLDLIKAHPEKALSCLMFLIFFHLPPSLSLTIISFLVTLSPSSWAAHYICYVALNLRRFHFKQLPSVQTSANKRLSTDTKEIGNCTTKSMDPKE